MATPSINLSRVWKTVTPAVAGEAVSFWRQHRAISMAEAQQRASELVVVARDEAGAVCGVTTVAVKLITQLHLPCFYYRMFISPRNRSQHLAREMLAETVRTLSADSVIQQADGPKGVLLEMHNPKIEATIRELVWKVREFDFVYIGRSSTNHMMRVYYFPEQKLPG